MIDFPITDLLNDAECLLWLERHLHPQGFVCPHCGSSERRLFRRQHIPAYRCCACDGYYTVVSGTVFEKTRKRPSTLVMLVRGVAKGKPTARLSRELNLDRKRLSAIRFPAGQMACRASQSSAKQLISKPSSCCASQLVWPNNGLTTSRPARGRRARAPASRG